MCNICPESALTLLLLLSLAPSMLQCVLTQQTTLLLLRRVRRQQVRWCNRLSRTAALGSVSLQIGYQEVQNAISRRQRCLFGVTHRHTPNVHTSAKTNPPPTPLMAYHRFYFICFIYFLAESATSASANTNDQRADTGNQNHFSGAFLFPVPRSRHNGVWAHLD